MRTLGAEVCSIFLEDPAEPGVLVMTAGSGFAQPLVAKARYRLGEGFTGSVAETGQKFNIRSREELQSLEVGGRRVWEGRFDSTQWPSGRSEFRNMIALPLKIRDRTLGVIKVENKLVEHGDFFTDEDENYFETIANVVALAIENARLHQSIERQLKTIAAKAAHRIGNFAADYDGIQTDLSTEASSAVPSRQRLQELVGRVRDTTKSLKMLVHDVATFGKPLIITPIIVDVNKVIRDEAWHAHPPSWIDIRLELSDELEPMPLDPRFAEALKELIRNATKAIGDQKGEIRLCTSCSESQLGNVRIDVVDSGPGFPSELPVFEPFVSTDPSSTGLGLATVRELVEAHGGSVEAYNGDRGGARVTLWLRRER
jgi:signal transduction histidine kinase